MKNFFKKKSSNKNHETINIIGKCPKCGGSLIEQDDYCVCLNTTSRTCTFRIPLTIGNTKIDAQFLNIINELEAVHSAVVKSKQNKIEDNCKDSEALHLPCGNCGSKIIKKDDYAICTNEKCGLKAYSNFKNIHFTDKELAEMMCYGVSPSYFFHKPGQPSEGFIARVVLDIDDNLKLISKYRFIRNMDHVEKKYLDNYYQYQSENKKMSLREVIKRDINRNHFY